ncbi:hypothetical protein BT93_H3549 [Corymbia citriodora subsp. variegata]|nr:hypothetical protein BT93_H3549 [Corymbia citriodora subsp. variegata]
MVVTFLASTPLLKEAWRLCSTGNATGCGAFVGGVGYVAFSGIQELLMLGWDPNCTMLAPLDAAGHGLFKPLTRRYEGEEPVMVDSGVLHRFLHYHSRPDLQTQIHSLLDNSKSIVITGHSIGGSIAFLTALWLLSKLKSIFPSVSILCIGFGSPFLGNESLSKAILRERWGSSFCNIVSMHDILPRLFLDQSLVPTPQWQALIRFWYTSMMSPNSMNFANHQLTKEDKAWLFSFATANMERLAQVVEGSGWRLFWPSGNYLFCSNEGTICLDNAVSVNKMMHLMLRTGSPNCFIEEHINYGWYVEGLTCQSIKRSFMEGDISESSYEASLSMALNSSGTSQEVSIASMAKGCLKMVRQMGCTLNQNAANLAIRLSKIAPYRVEIEWYKACCDNSDEGAKKREYRINMNRFKLAAFWDDVIRMLDRNELPLNFHRSSEWVIEESQLYKLLVEPLEIAQYYRLGIHLTKGHYISNGRERRYGIFNQWWNERVVTEKLGHNRRTKYASLTQDTCFWARVEEAKEWLDKIKRESDPNNLAFFQDKLDKFEAYAMKLVEGKEVSIDVLAKNSSFSSCWFAQRPIHFAVPIKYLGIGLQRFNFRFHVEQV